MVATVSSLVLLSACGRATPVVKTAAVPTITATPTTTTPAPTTSTTATPRPSTTRAPAKPKTVPQLAHVTGNQAIVVTTPKYGATDATLVAYTRRTDGWHATFGPWSAYVGAKGIAPAGEKREGDGRTPTGTFGFDFMFGVKPDPGVKYEYRVINGPNIVWVENPQSPFYNQWIDSNQHPEEADQDSMYKPGVYDYGAVIAYNTKERTPGLGSGIFLHISHNKPTAGCVSMTVDHVLSILRWLDPDASPAIVIGVA